MVRGGLLALAVAAVGFVGCGRGGGSPERFEKMVSWKVDDALDDVDATDSQRAQIQGLSKKLVADAKPLMEQHRAARDELIQQWSSDRPDAARVHALIDERAEAMRAYAHKVADAMIETHQTLTPAQRAELGERLSKRKHHKRR